MLNWLLISLQFCVQYDEAHDIIPYFSFFTFDHNIVAKLQIRSETGHEDSSRLKYKDSNVNIPNGQAKTFVMWINPRDLSSPQPDSYYNMPGQTTHAAYLPSHSSHVCCCCTIFSYAVSRHVPSPTTANCNGQSSSCGSTNDVKASNLELAGHTIRAAALRLRGLSEEENVDYGGKMEILNEKEVYVESSDSYNNKGEKKSSGKSK
ncbi:unnamed protein product [Fraxinus pennsylvanica]|uniref:Uncharacterized protein n=1 Tax=Fraxinus pennsylvanica TaxID=56036 RepID=A0AAD1YNL8_9LAMI|nr:unnamed protein product [Fraxinus pennsylvanica]